MSWSALSLIGNTLRSCHRISTTLSVAVKKFYCVGHSLLLLTIGNVAPKDVTSMTTFELCCVEDLTSSETFCFDQIHRHVYDNLTTLECFKEGKNMDATFKLKTQMSDVGSDRYINHSCY